MIPSSSRRQAPSRLPSATVNLKERSSCLRRPATDREVSSFFELQPATGRSVGVSIESAGLQFQSDRRQFSLQVKLTPQTNRAVGVRLARRDVGEGGGEGGGGQSQIGTVEKGKGSHTQKESVKKERERERVGMLNGTGRGGASEQQLPLAEV